MKNDLKKKLVKNDLSGQPQIEKVVVPLQEMLNHIYKLEEYAQLKIRDKFQRLSRQKQKRHKIQKVMPSLIKNRRPFLQRASPKINLINRQIFQNIHEGSGFYPIGTKIMNCRYQPDYRKLIVEKANRKCSNTRQNWNNKKLKSDDKMNQTMYVRKNQHKFLELQGDYKLLNESNLSKKLVDFIISEQRQRSTQNNLTQLLIRNDPFRKQKIQKVKYKKHTSKKVKQMRKKSLYKMQKSMELDNSSSQETR